MCRHTVRRLDAQQPEAPSKREMLAAVHQITSKPASVEAAWSVLTAWGFAGLTAQHAANGYSATPQLHSDGQSHAPAVQPTSLEAHIQAHLGQGQPVAAAGEAAEGPVSRPQSWKRRFWELHRELRGQQDSQRQLPQSQQCQQWQALSNPQLEQSAPQPQTAPAEPGRLPPSGLSMPPDPTAAHQPSALHHVDGAVSNVVPFRPAKSPPARGGLGGPDDPDPRPIVLFDLNGTLTSHTASRRSAGTNKMRPGTPDLRRLQVRPPSNALSQLHDSHVPPCTFRTRLVLQPLLLPQQGHGSRTSVVTSACTSYDPQCRPRRLRSGWASSRRPASGRSAR